MDNLFLAKNHKDYWIGRAQELMSNPHQLAEEIFEFIEESNKEQLIKMERLHESIFYADTNVVFKPEDADVVIKDLYKQSCSILWFLKGICKKTRCTPSRKGG